MRAWPPAELVDAAGARVPVGERLVIGRAHEADVVVQSGTVARHHLALVPLLSGEVEAQDLGTTNGTRLNGEPLAVAVLRHGDVLEIAGRHWTFTQGHPVEGDLSAEVALAQRLRDDAALQVWVDELLERGEPLGAALATGQPLPLPAVLKDAVAAGLLLLTWRGGFVRAARLRRQATLLRVRELLFALLRAEAARFLEALALPEPSPRFGLERAGLPALRRLSVGPFFRRADASAAEEALAAAAFPGAPRLGRPVVELHERAWLDFGGGAVRPLDRGEQAGFPSCVVRWEPGGWVVAPAGPLPTPWPLHVGGRPRPATFLLPDDEVRSGATRFVFRAA